MARLRAGAAARFRASFDRVVDILRTMPEASNVYCKVIDSKPRLAVLVGEKYWLRAGNAAVATTIVEERSGYTVVRVVSAGSKQGLLDFMDWGATKKHAESIIKKLSEALGVPAENYRYVDHMECSKTLFLDV